VCVCACVRGCMCVFECMRGGERERARERERKSLDADNLENSNPVLISIPILIFSCSSIYIHMGSRNSTYI